MTTIWSHLDAMSQLAAAVIVTWFFAITLVCAWWYRRWSKRHEQPFSPDTEAAIEQALIVAAEPAEWDDAAIARLLDAMNDPHLFDEPLTEYELKAWAEMERRLS